MNANDLGPFDDVRLLAELGHFALAAGDRGAARTLFEGVAAAVPRSPVGHLGLAEVLLGEGDRTRAIEACQRALRAPASDPESLAAGLALLAVAEPDAARRADAWREAVRAWPDGPLARLLDPHGRA